MYLVCRNRRSLEYGQSCVGEDSAVRMSCRPVLPADVAIVGGRCAPSEAVALVICTHAVEAVAARQLSFEVIDVR
jgi:hypothetical protein